jgi:tetraacyldisaccharide 4'-kinase
MRAPKFWHQPSLGLRARLLAPFGDMIGRATARAMATRGLDVGVPVITVGNFTVGGAGKTPVAVALARLLLDCGEHPAFLSRGYGGTATLDAVHVQDQPAAIVGDEPLLLARVAPTFIGAMRVRAAHLALKTVRPSVLICDDGLQSRSLEPTLAIAVVDAETGVGNHLCIPAGPLRAPLERQIEHIDALVLVGSGDAGEEVAARAEAVGKPCFYADLEPGVEVQALAGERVVAFAGIGRPEKFFAMLDAHGARIVAARAFADHHPYRPREIERLIARARTEHALLLTTEKDEVRLPRFETRGPKPRAIPVQLVFRDGFSVRDFVLDAIRG